MHSSNFKPFLCLYPCCCNPKQMRVATNNFNGKDERGGDSIVCSTTRLTGLSRFISLIKRCWTKQSLLSGSCGRNGTDPSKNQSSSLSLENSNSPPETDAPAGRHMEVAFNVGLGFGVMYLIASCKNEFDKMTELRTQMERLIQDFKSDLSRKDETSMECDDKNLKYDSPEREEIVVGSVDQMETELKLELERLMEVNLDTEDLSRPHLQTQKTEVTTHGDGTSSLELVEINEEEECNEDEGGVSPKELERRLHELLESRQQERITELEHALECAKKRLHQKEMEASWWKDTARLISHHVSDSKCLSR